jgi:hypothetical protein
LTGAASENHDRPYDPDGTLDNCIRSQVTHCESTIEELGKIVKRLWPRNKKFVDRTVRQFKLQDAKEQIDDLRARIRSHTDALHTVLHVLSIKVAHISPGQAMGQLPETLDDLRRTVLRIEEKLEQRPVAVDDDMPMLVKYARGALRSGETLFDESVAGSIAGVDSVIGGEQAAFTNKTVAEWILSAEQTGHEFQDVSPEYLAGINISADAPGQLESVGSSQTRSDYDSNEEQAEFARAAFEAGSSAFDKQDWQSATDYLMISKKIIVELPVNHRESRFLFELQYKVGVCSYHLGSADNGASELQELLKLEPDSDEQRIQQCNAYDMLAKVYICQNKLDDAKGVCQRTLDARSRLLGKQHEARLESLALLSRICEILGEEVHSKVYLSMIPENQRKRLIAAMSVLQPSGEDMKASCTPEGAQGQSAGTAEGRNATKARVTGCNQSPPRTVPGPSAARSKDGESSTRKSSVGIRPTTDSPRMRCSPSPNLQSRNSPSDGAAQPEPSKKGSAFDVASRDRPKKSTCPDVTDSYALDKVEKTTMSPKTDYKGASPPPGKRRQARRAPKAAPTLPISVEALLQKPDAREGMTALREAIGLDDADAVNTLLRWQPSHRVQSWLSKKDGYGSTPLFFAMRRATSSKDLPLDIIRSLLEYGADVEERDVEWKTRLWRGTAKSLALNSGRDDLVALVTRHSQRHKRTS